MCPKVSVIVPCYNYGHLLAETLTSVKNQTLQCWECIIVDDGSTDNTKEVALSFVNCDSRFIYKYQENSGPSASRNAGVKESCGEYLQFLDADDLIEPRKLESQVHFFKDNPQIDIIYSGVRFFTTDNPLLRLHSMWGDNQKSMPNVSGSGMEIMKHLLKENIMVVNSTLIRRSLFESCGGFDVALSSHEDWELWLRYAMRNSFFFFLDVMGSNALVRYHPISLSHDRIKMYETNLFVRRMIAPALKERYLSKINFNCYLKICLRLSVEYIKKKKYIKGLVAFVRSMWGYIFV